MSGVAASSAKSFAFWRRGRRGRRAAGALFCCVPIVVLSAGCGRSPSDGERPRTASETRTDERVGPIRSAVFGVAPAEGPADELFVITLRVELDDGAAVAGERPRGALVEAMGLPAVWRPRPRDLELSREPMTAGGVIETIVVSADVVPGEFSIGPATVEAIDAAGALHTLSMPPVPVTVRSTLGEASDAALAAERGADDPPIRLPWAVLAAIVLGVIVLLAGLVFAARRAIAQFGKPRAVPPHELALRELDAVDASLSPADRLDRVAGVARRYIERRFAIDAPDRTTEEFLRETADQGDISPDDRERLGAFLASCDLVKFAQHSADQSAVETATADVRAFIERSASDRVVVLVDRAGRIVGRVDRDASSSSGGSADE